MRSGPSVLLGLCKRVREPYLAHKANGNGFGRLPILPLFLSLLLLGGLLYLLGWVKKDDVGWLTSRIRQSSGVIFVVGAAFLVTRNLGLAIFAGMLAYSVFARTGLFQGTRRAGALSTVRTAYLEMTLDHATGIMSGRVLKGRFAGRALTNLTAVERSTLLSELRANDGQGAQLFEAFLDRTAPGWNGRNSRFGGSAGNERSKGMTAEEAYLVLGLTPGASRDDVQAAHRNLMKRFHPDQGGSTYIAAKVNEAKEVLLNKLKV
jgi:hypothetical protein